MKKVFAILFFVGVGMMLIWGGVFYWQNLRGVGPALKAPSEDIVKLIEQANTSVQNATETVQVLPPGRNTTEMPLKVPDGFSISVFAKGLGKPRVMIHAPNGGLLVSIPSQGKVVRVHDADGDGIADEILTVASGLNRPHGMATRCDTGDVCKLYIAESDKVAMYNYDSERSLATNKKKIIDLPDGGNHFTRTIMFMPVHKSLSVGRPYPNQDKLLISVGSTCNVCNEKDWRRAKILVANADGSNLEVFASGLRNSVFMAIHPIIGKIWATEMGRDLLGDDTPPDEINIVEEGKNYGWPICYGKNIHDDSFDKNISIRNPCREPFETPSHIDIPAHSSPLGLVFAPGEGWPEQYRHNLFVAYHGSWNRTDPTGYKIVRYKLDAQGNYLGTEDFISGWLKGGEALGRPVDMLIQPDGTMYISDDKAGVIYRVAYHPAEYAYRYKDLVEVDALREGDSIASPFIVKGKARGNWFFEASFPVRLFDAAGSELAIGVAQAKGDWMTTDFVPFEVKLEFQKPAAKTGVLVLEKDNPSGLPEHDDAARIPVRFEE